LFKVELAFFGSLKQFKRIMSLQSGTEVDIRNKYFKTPLMASCAEGNLRLVKYLISLG